MKILLVFLLILISEGDSTLFSIQLLEIDNSRFSLEKIKNSKATVIVFLLTDCPASQSYTRTLNKMAEKYKLNKIRIVGVFPGKYSTVAEMIEFKKTYKIVFPLLQDPDLKLVKELKADVAPGAFLLNTKGEVMYSGRIDDWMYAVGKKRPNITTNDLDASIQCILQNKTIKVKKTKAIGCLIES